MKQFTHLAFATFLIAGFTSCDEVGCIDPNALNFNIDALEDDGSCQYMEQNTALLFSHKAGAGALELNTEYVTQGGTRFMFTNVQWYLCNFTFDGDSGQQTIAETYRLIGNDDDTVMVGNLPSGAYTNFSFAIGVDSAANHADPSTWPSQHALSSNQPRFEHWGWDTGYLFAVIVGYVDTSAAGTGPLDKGFNFHIGTDALFRTMTFTRNFTVTGNAITYLPISIDYLHLFDGIDLRTEYSTHSMGNQRPLATRFSDNYPTAITTN